MIEGLFVDLFMFSQHLLGIPEIQILKSHVVTYLDLNTFPLIQN